MRDWRKQIEVNPKILVGKPVIKGTRISVEIILEKLAQGETINQILDAYPHIRKEQVLACISYASESLKNEVIHSIVS